MQLKSLYIKDYKNLKDFHLDFSSSFKSENQNGLSIIVGNNGSGKSNVLETISGIFAEAYGKKNINLKTDYELKYQFESQEVSLTKKDGRRHCFINQEKVSIESLSVLPDIVIAFYSGENKKLYNFYSGFQKSYNHIASQKQAVLFPRMEYVDSKYGLPAFLTEDLFKDSIDDIGKLFSELKILEITSLTFKFDLIAIKNNRNEHLKYFIEKINSEFKETKSFTMEDFMQVLGKTSDNNFYYDRREIFSYLSQAFVANERPLIKDLDIRFNGDMTFEDLSEGEQKLVNLLAIEEFVATENSLILLDEPDANIHESRKEELYFLLRQYSNRQTIMTTHSLILAKLVKKEELIYLESETGRVNLVDSTRLEMIKNLASPEWNIMEAGIFLNSDKPLILFEGKSDVDFVKKAIDLLKDDEPKYRKINADFLSFNGTGNAESFIKNVRDCASQKKIIIFFDRDEAGKTAMEKLSGSRTNEFISSDNLLKVVLYPYTKEVSSGDFLLEDYFSEKKISEIVNSLVNSRKHPVKCLPNLAKQTKAILGKEYLDFTKEDFEGFKVLLDKILEMIE